MSKNTSTWIGRWTERQWILSVDAIIHQKGEEAAADFVRTWAEIIWQRPPIVLSTTGEELPMPPVNVMSSLCDICDETADVVRDYKIRIGGDSRYGYRLIHATCMEPKE